MLVIGLTGGIGSGKSEVSKVLAQLGAAVIDADKVGHEAYQTGSTTWKEVVAAFGQDVLGLDKEIDRKKLGDIVFSDSKALKKLNSIVHPAMYRMFQRRLKELDKQGTKVTVLEAAVLIEAGWMPLVDEVWVTTSTEAKAVERVRSRSGLSEELIRARIKTQLSQEERVKHANVVIDNNGDLSSLKEKVESLWYKRIMERREKQ